MLEPATTGMQVSDTLDVSLVESVGTVLKYVCHKVY